MSELAELKQQLVDLTKWRAGVIAEAQATVNAANRQYDDEATRLNRAIRRLEPKIESGPAPAPQPTVKVTRKRQPRFSLEGMEDWTPEEIAHYKRLKGVAA